LRPLPTLRAALPERPAWRVGVVAVMRGNAPDECAAQLAGQCCISMPNTRSGSRAQLMRPGRVRAARSRVKKNGGRHVWRRFAVIARPYWLSEEKWSALAARDADRFWLSIRQCVVIVAVPIYAFYYYVRDTLGIFWRRWLTNRFLDRYFTDRAYYELNVEGSIDNPDQRVSEDINAFTQQSLYCLMIAVGAVIQRALPRLCRQGSRVHTGFARAVTV